MNVLVIPVVVVDDCSFAVIRYKNAGYAAEIFIHMNMGGDSGLLFLIEKRFYVGVQV